MKNTLYLLSALSLIALAGCTSMGNSSVASETNESIQDKIKIGKTTKDEVAVMYGKPTSTSSSASSNESWTYMFSSSRADGKNFIPVVGMFIANNQYASNMLVITFRKDGVVSDYHFNATSTDSQWDATGKGKPAKSAATDATPETSGHSPLLDDKGRMAAIAALSEKDTIGDEQTESADFGAGMSRRTVEVVHKKGQAWRLVVFAQRPANKWQMVVNREVTLAQTKGLKFGGTVDLREGSDDEAPSYQCLVNGKKVPAFGFMTFSAKTYVFKHAANGKELVWTLDGNDNLVSLAKDKVECKPNS